MEQIVSSVLHYKWNDYVMTISVVLPSLFERTQAYFWKAIPFNPLQKVINFMPSPLCVKDPLFVGGRNGKWGTESRMWVHCGMFIWASDNALHGGYCICSEIIILPQYCSSIHCMVHTATPPPLKVSPPTSAAPLTLLAHPSLHLMWQALAATGPTSKKVGKM